MVRFRFGNWSSRLVYRCRLPRRPVRGLAVSSIGRVQSFEQRILPTAQLSEFVDPNPAPGNQFGYQVIPLSTGNVIVTSPGDDLAGSNAGAVYLFNGTTGALLSALRGSHASDNVGAGTITLLSNGNFLVRSAQWDNGAIVDAGAVTWGSGITGVDGFINAANSLIGGSVSDQVGSSITTLTNGNYLVRTSSWDNGTATNAGAVTWGSGTTGVSGLISAANSLVGSSSNDQIGSSGISTLPSGNYLVRSSAWDNGTAVDAGALTWGSGTTGIRGIVSAANSLVGSTSGDGVGNSVTILSNGNYVSLNSSWDNGPAANAGAVTWGSGTSGIGGVISAANSLVGGTASDQVGAGFIALPSGNYLITTSSWDNGALVDVGAVTWCNGSTGLTGLVSTANSLYGPSAGDTVGGTVQVLTNGNYVVRSFNWHSGGASSVGALTWGSGTAPLIGPVNASNSLVGSTAGDQIGGLAISEVAGGNYVILSSLWDNGAAANAGAVTWASGTAPVTGVVGPGNSLVGSKSNDLSSASISILPSGNYLVASTGWDNGAAIDAGSVTWGSGTAGVQGVISAANSLVGTQSSSVVGSGGITVLSNGNYIVNSFGWDNGSFLNTGAVTWGSGTLGVSGAVSAANSLVGAIAGDQVGSNGIVSLTNGNYLVLSTAFQNSGITGTGAVTWGSGTTGVTGVVSASNSLVGSRVNDQVGVSTTVLSNGNYVVRSAAWDNGSVQDAGAVTWGNGATGISGAVSPLNSLVGSLSFDGVGGSITTLPNGNYVVISTSWDNGAAANAGAVTFGNGLTGIVGAVSSANSLVGGSTSDQVGSSGITVLGNGNFLVKSQNWRNGTQSAAGALTWASGTAGVSGVVSAANSLIGQTASDGIGAGPLTTLTNGNVILVSPNWDNGAIVNAGAATWINANTGVTGVVSAANSLIGTTAGDAPGSAGALALPNGAFVVRSPSWDNGAVANVGAATWGSPTAGVRGVISAANSLVGSTASDQVGNSVIAVGNGNYIVTVSSWDNGAVANVGAVAWGSGAAGVKGVISAANSLIGTTTGDGVGSSLQLLTNGNYVVRTTLWDNGAVVDAGAVTWGDGANGVTGQVSAANSLVGSTASDRVGETGITQLAGGDYLIRSANWDNGSAVNAGAITWASGTAPITGIVSPANSLVGTTGNDRVGFTTPMLLPNGNFLISTPDFDNGGLTDAGAVTWGSGTAGVAGVINKVNSAIARTSGAGTLINIVQDAVNDTFDVAFGLDGGGTVFVGSMTVGFVNAPPSAVHASNLVSELSEDTTTPSSVALATVSIDDDGRGTNSLSLSGADAAAFQIVGGVLQLKPGVVLDYESKYSYTVRIQVDDPSVGATPDAFVDYTLTITDVDEFDVTIPVDNDPVANGVVENAATGTVVNVTVFASDADGTNNGVTYTLLNTGGRFQIDPVTGVITVANGALLNYEASPGFFLTIRATSADGSTATQVFGIPIIDVDEFDVSVPTDADATPSLIDENTANGTLVHITASAFDADGTNNTVTYSLVSSLGGRFAIDPTTGVVTVANGSLIDYESASSYSLQVRATGSDGSTATATFPVNVRDVDEFNIGVISDSNPLPNIVLENAASGTAVGLTAFATDPDGSNNSVSYSLVDDLGGRFAIDSSTGIVTVANGALLNYESTTAWFLQVRATSTDGSSKTQVFAINVQDVDEFDVGPIVDTLADPDTVHEVTGVFGAVGIWAKAVDQDGTNNDVSYSLFDSAGGRFGIEPQAGIVYVADNTRFDYETTASYTIIVRADSTDGSFSTRSFAIAVLDDSEFAVSTPVDSNSTPNSVAERAPNGTQVGLTAFASDADATTNTVSYSLANDAGGRFAIDAVTGVVTVAHGSLLDYETATSHLIIVRAKSADGTTSTQSFVINVTDVNDNPISAVSDTNPAANSVLENSPNGTAVGITGFAVDPDGTNNAITYSLTANANGRFAINPTTGVVTVAKSEWLDREAAAAWSITVKATSQDGSSNLKAFSVTLLDALDTPVGAISDTDPAGSSVNERAPNGTLVGITASAVDKDLTNNGVTYSLTSNAGGRFAIDPVTGVVTVAKGEWLDREAAAAWSITVKAASQDGSSSVKAFTITLNDINDNSISAVSDLDPAASVILETASNGTAVGVTARAMDPDITNNAVTYSLTNSANGRFAVDPVTGVVMVANSSLLDLEAAGAGTTAWGITVKATSQDGSSTTAPFSIQVTPVNEFPVSPVTDSNSAANQVPENAANGTLVGVTAAANDPDVTGNSVTYSLVNNAGGRFAIDPSSGVVSVADGTLLDFETATSHQITVKAMSEDGSSTTATFTIAVTDVSETPEILLSNNTIEENPPTGTVVGSLTITNLNVSSPVYTLVSGTGSNDNARFKISGDQLQTKSPLNFEVQSSYSVRVQMRDASGQTVFQVLTISLRNVNEAPTGLALSQTSIAENNAVGTVVGTFSGVDPDAGDTLTYTLVSGTGSTDNAKFTISGNQLKAAESFDYEKKKSYTIRVRVTDAAGLFFEKSFTINVTNAPG